MIRSDSCKTLALLAQVTSFALAASLPSLPSSFVVTASAASEKAVESKRSFDFRYAFNGHYSPSILLDESADLAPHEPLRTEWSGRWVIEPDPQNPDVFRHRFVTERFFQSGLTENDQRKIILDLGLGIETAGNPLEKRDCKKSLPALEFRTPTGASRISRNLLLEILTSSITCLPKAEDREVVYRFERPQGPVTLSSKRVGSSNRDWSSKVTYERDDAPGPLNINKNVIDEATSDWTLSKDLSRLESGHFRQEVTVRLQDLEFSKFRSTLDLRSVERLDAPVGETNSSWSEWRKAEIQLYEDEAFLRISETEIRRWSWKTFEAAFRKKPESKHYLVLRSFFAIRPETLHSLRDRVLESPIDGREFGLIALAAAGSPVAATQRAWIDMADRIGIQSGVKSGAKAGNEARLLAWMMPLVSNTAPQPELVSWIEKRIGDRKRPAVAERARFLMSIFAFRHRFREPAYAERLLRSALASSAETYEKLGLMGNAGLSGSLPELERVLAHSEDADLRAKAVDAMRYIPGNAITERLSKLIAGTHDGISGDDEIRMAAAQALHYRKINGVIHTASLTGAFDSEENESIRLRILALIGKLAEPTNGASKDPAAVKWLRELQQSPSEAVTPEMKRRAQAYLSEAAARQ